MSDGSLDESLSLDEGVQLQRFLEFNPDGSVSGMKVDSRGVFEGNDILDSQVGVHDQKTAHGERPSHEVVSPVTDFFRSLVNTVAGNASKVPEKPGLGTVPALEIATTPDKPVVLASGEVSTFQKNPIVRMMRILKNQGKGVLNALRIIGNTFRQFDYDLVSIDHDSQHEQFFLQTYYSFESSLTLAKEWLLRFIRDICTADPSIESFLVDEMEVHPHEDIQCLLVQYLRPAVAAVKKIEIHEAQAQELAEKHPDIARPQAASYFPHDLPVLHGDHPDEGASLHYKPTKVQPPQLSDFAASDSV